jgi:hypothetical protein
MKNIVHNLKRKISIFLEIFDSVLSTHKSCLCTRAYISIRYDIWYVKRQYNHTNEICVHLTDISDTLSRDVKKLSNENRLSRNLKNFDFEKTKDIEINLYKKVLPDKETTIIIDGSDIANTQTHKRDLRACLCAQKQSFGTPFFGYRWL